MFNGRMKSALVPSEYFSIDEIIYAMRHQIGFRQSSYGLLYKSLNDAQSPYTYQVMPYYEKPVDGNDPYFLSRTENYVKHLVELMPASSVKSRNISMDRLCTSISTAIWLLAQNFTSVGTLVSNLVTLPDEVKDAKNRDEFESSMYWEQEEGNLAFCVYTTN